MHVCIYLCACMFSFVYVYMYECKCGRNEVQADVLQKKTRTLGTYAFIQACTYASFAAMKFHVECSGKYIYIYIYIYIYLYRSAAERIDTHTHTHIEGQLKEKIYTHTCVSVDGSKEWYTMLKCAGFQTWYSALHMCMYVYVFVC
jgi:hypothetical protein